MEKDANPTRVLTPEQHETLLACLEARFEKNKSRHAGIVWADMLARLEAHPAKLWSIHKMESTGGEPDVVGPGDGRDGYTFVDCSAESPEGRRNICYDRAALESRKKFTPADNAMDLAAAMGIEMLTEEQYRALQAVGKFDTKTSSWIRTPDRIRRLGGALFCDRRYDTVFVYHNGADSYYGVRGFRGAVTV